MNNYSLTLNNPAESSTADLQVDLLGVKKAALILRALNHKLRQQILRLIDENGRSLQGKP